MRKMLTALVLAALCGTASAAEITLIEREGYKPVVEIRGYIESGDYERLLETLGKRVRGIAILEGVGGKVDASLKIGRTLAARGFQTYIRPKEQCLSSCAIIWIVGKDRYMGKRATVGFHTVYSIETGERREATNNWIKHYYMPMARLKPEVADYLTKAGPGELTLLTPKDAKRVGIPVKFNAEPDWKAQQ